ncbi:MAG: membrane protein insertase YidC [Sediminimonas sp.]|uniref:membrane protein insertase YidC n=1 Tax=Sediminimonas sp. TaxID=2823379 RepID=UPI00286FB28F|nr:membrane protein insertase YidC [Sediminimonas sp.]MDR9484834.1 membrane protein insertase YidC [Sediminimonas sp.]
MDDQNKNLILATALSFAVILIWFVLFPPPEPTPTDPNAPVESVQGEDPAEQAPAGTPSAPADKPAATGAQEVATAQDAPRIEINTPRVSGSISLIGGRIDQLSLKDYRKTLEPGAEIVDMLSPLGSENPYYALYGWAPGAGVTLDQVPGANTEWRVQNGDVLTQNSPVTLMWDNGSGLLFKREIAIDRDFMFTVTQTVENTGNQTATLAPYGILTRHGEPENLKNFFILHEGLIAMSDGELTETGYSDMPDFAYNDREGARADVTQVSENGWIGFTDHYWMTTLIPEPGSPFKAVAKYDQAGDTYQTEAVLPTQTVAPGASTTAQTRLFAGAKEWATIREYENRGGVQKFLDSIDWGWFFFLTKPIFAVLHWLNATMADMGIAGSMGWAIIALTLLIKAILFPLAYKSYASMAKMKELQPKMEEIKKSAGDDRQKLQQEMMALYKKEKVNPASGCLPILLQIPIFFSLYKVIFVTLELRHAPWIGWLRDLSAPDPSSILNLFGLLPFAPPDPNSILAILSLGVLPILLGISMFLQQKLNPAPTDKTQAMIFAWMPWVFMFMLGQFASGLVLYWIANNTITFTQQYLIMRSHGYKPNVFGNIISSFRKKPDEDKE